MLKNLFSVTEEQRGFRLYKVFNMLGIKFRKRITTRFDILNKEKFERELSKDEKEYLINCVYNNIFGTDCNFKTPKTLNEKIQWLKLNYKNDLMTKCADKYLVKEYVKEKIGDGHTISLLGVYDTPDEIDFDSLPNQFVVKVNWGSGQNIVVEDKSKLDINDAKQKLKEWLKPQNNNYFIGFEWCYKNIEPKIIIEQFIPLKSDDVEYQFFCFNEDIKFILAEINGKYSDNWKRIVYDKDWNVMPFTIGNQKKSEELPKPELFDNMCEIAKTLSEPFPITRVDMIINNDVVKIMEMTFYSGAGYSIFKPNEWNYKLGDMLDLSEYMNDKN